MDNSPVDIALDGVKELERILLELEESDMMSPQHVESAYVGTYVDDFDYNTGSKELNKIFKDIFKRFDNGIKNWNRQFQEWVDSGKQQLPGLVWNGGYSIRAELWDGEKWFREFIQNQEDLKSSLIKRIDNLIAYTNDVMSNVIEWEKTIKEGNPEIVSDESDVVYNEINATLLGLSTGIKALYGVYLEELDKLFQPMHVFAGHLESLGSRGKYEDKIKYGLEDLATLIDSYPEYVAGLEALKNI